MRDAPRACRRAFVTDSCAIRYTADATVGGMLAVSPSTRTCTRGLSSVLASCSISARTRLGARSGASPWRSTRTIERISARVVDASASITRRASVAASGFDSATANPACARMAIADTWWATVSCRSRASISRSMSRAPSNSRSLARARKRRTSPSITTTAKKATSPMRSPKPVPVNADTIGLASTMADPTTRARPLPQRYRA